MSFEKPQPIPEESELPLRIIASRGAEHQGRENALWEVETKDTEGRKRLLALKQIREERFATEEELIKSRKFYDYLKSIPGFGRFVVDSLYMKARVKTGDRPSAFRLQKMIEGKRLDEIEDDELYADPKLVKELLEFIDASIFALEKARKDGEHSPDVYGDTLNAAYLFNPRESSNVIIGNKPDETGQRVFFVDTYRQSQQEGKLGKGMQKHIGSRLQVVRLKQWRRVIEKKLVRIAG